MSPPNRSRSAPLTFDLPQSLITKIGRARKSYRSKTSSEIVRLALRQFDLEKFRPTEEPHRQISVRIDVKTRASLRKVARQTKASIGEIIRAAIEALPAVPARGGRR